METSCIGLRNELCLSMGLFVSVCCWRKLKELVMIIEECYQKSFATFFLLKTSIGFTLGQVPRLSSLRFLVTQVVWVWVLSHGMGLQSGTDWLLPQALCHHCTSISWSVAALPKVHRQGLQLGWRVHFSFGSTTGCLPVPKMLEPGGEVSVE